MTTQEAYADKIRKLLLKAESTTPEEAELLFAKAQELMSKYAIDEAMLAASDKANHRADPIVWDEFVTVGIYRHALYMIDYYVLLVNDCKPIELSGRPWREVDGKVYKETRVLRAVGHKSDVNTAKILATSLKLQCMRAESAWWNEHKDLYRGQSAGKQHQARRGFMLAFGAATFTRMKAAADRAKAAANTEHGASSVALVLRDKAMIVASEFEREYPKVRKSTSRLSQGDAFARGKGREAGQRADLGGPAFGGSRKAINS